MNTNPHAGGAGDRITAVFSWFLMILNSLGPRLSDMRGGAGDRITGNSL